MATCGTITVSEPAPPFDPSEVEVVDCSISASEITEGGFTTVEFSVSNGNDVSAQVDIGVTFGSQTLFANRYSLAAGEVGFESVELGSVLSPGDYSVEVSASNAQEASVTPTGGMALVKQLVSPRGGVSGDRGAFGLNRRNGHRVTTDGGCSSC